jgi:hypothetical protein
MDTNLEIALSTSISREETVFVADSEFTAILASDLEEGGYTVECKQIPAAISQGETIQNALDNIISQMRHSFAWRLRSNAESGRDEPAQFRYVSRDIVACPCLQESFPWPLIT